MSSTIAPPVSSKGTILIIEDNANNAEMAIDLLEGAGFTALHALNADEGIELAHCNHPNVILMDMFLPHKSGLEATHILKKDPDLKDIPVVAFTSMGFDAEREQFMAEGCDGLITKPIDVDRFADSVANYLSPQSQSKLGPEVRLGPPTPPRQPQVAISPIELLAAQKALQETISKFSHDVQAPARKVHQFCSMVLASDDASLSPENRMMVERIDRSSQQMLDILAKSLAQYAATWRV
jgi:two-component system cell cycle response regulator DivK